MAPWKIVLQPQKVSRAARVSGMLEIKGNPSNYFYNLLQSVTFYTFVWEYKNIHGIDVPIISIDRE